MYTTCVGKKPMRRVNGMSNALSIATDLGFSVAHPPSHKDCQNVSDDELVTILRELTGVQRKIADLQVEFRGRKEDDNVAHLTHVSEMENKSNILARIIDILEDVIRDKDRIIACLQRQPYSSDCIPVEAEYQKQFSELLMKAASDYDALTASVRDLQWSQDFNEQSTVWREMLSPISVALGSCARFFEAVTAMRESFVKLQALRVGQDLHSS